MAPRDSIAVVLPAGMFGDTHRAVVDAHQDQTGHNGAFQLTPRGWECAVCTAIAQGDDMFKVPSSGPPPSGHFEEWAAAGYVWVR